MLRGQILVHGAAVLAEQSFAGNPMPRAFSEGQGPSVSFATDERSRLFWERARRSGRAAGGRIRARL